ncbi:MAG: methionyl-tRNA formyltransferase [Brevinema sp.]
MKIVFFGNSDFSVKSFEKLIHHFDVKALVTAPDSVIGRGQKASRLNPVKLVAEKHQIPILQPEKLKNNTNLFDQLKSFDADIFVIVSYGKIIPQDMITIPKYDTINLHSSLLPALRGAAPIQYALWQGLSETGNTVQFINEKMDEGDIIGQNSVTIEPEDNYISLENKLSHTGAKLLISCLEKIKDKSITRIVQNNEDATYTKMISKEDGAVYFSMTAEDIINTYRAFIVKPGIYFPLKIGNLKILDCAISDLPYSGKEGEILDVNDEGIVVSCYESTILLKKVQLPTKKPLCGKDFCNGNRLKKGLFLDHKHFNI